MAWSYYIFKTHRVGFKDESSAALMLMARHSTGQDAGSSPRHRRGDRWQGARYVRYQLETGDLYPHGGIHYAKSAIKCNKNSITLEEIEFTKLICNIYYSHTILVEYNTLL